MIEEEWQYHKYNCINICGYQCSKLPNNLYKIEGEPLMDKEQVERWCRSRNYIALLHGILAL